MALKDFLKKRLEEKKWAMYKLHKESGVSAGYINMMAKGNAENPSPDKLKKIAKAFGDPYEIWLEQAGYLNPDTEEIRKAFKLKFGILFKDDAVATILTKDGVSEILEGLYNLHETKKGHVIGAIKTIIKSVE
jgi:transcriptional regulator with XRE-family HTH domain